MPLGTLKAQILYYTKEEIAERKINKLHSDLGFVAKNDKTFVKIETLFWLEELLGIKRFAIQDINIGEDKMQGIKDKLLENINKVMMFREDLMSKKRLTERTTNNINKIQHNDQLQEFVSRNFYNTYGKIISYDVYKSNISRYKNFEIYDAQSKLHKLLKK